MYDTIIKKTVYRLICITNIAVQKQVVHLSREAAESASDAVPMSLVGACYDYI